MKTIISLSLLGLVSLPAWAASNPSNDVYEAAEKLADKPSYSWTAQQDQKQTNGFRFVPPDGKTEKSGFTLLAFKQRDTTTLALRKGDKPEDMKLAVMQGDEWKTREEMTEGEEGGGAGGGGGPGGGFNRGRFLLNTVERAKLPPEQATDLLDRVKELKKDGDGVYSGELSPEGIKAMFTFGGGRGGGRGGRGGGRGGTNTVAGADGPRRGGGGGFPPMDTSGLKGTAKFWVTDGVVTKFQTHIEGDVPGFNGGEPRDMTRTTTIQITDIGSTKVEVPAEVKKKLAKKA